MRALSDFEKGYLLACASIVTKHNEETIAADVARELGVSWKQIQKAGFDQSDLQALKVIQEAYAADPAFDA